MKCERCDHIEAVKANVVGGEPLSPTCASTGRRTYTASYNNTNYATTTREFPALGHKYAQANWRWYTVTKASGETWEAELSLDCGVCGSEEPGHTLIIDDDEVQVTCTTVKEATCLEKGLQIYTAVYDGVCGEYSATKSVITPALGHAWE